eukprot:1237854-Rhodomonas_salina.1
MECTREKIKKKWVLDLDGEIKKMHDAGFTASASFCTRNELHNFESASIWYAVLVLRCLFDIGCIGSETTVISVLRRHRFEGDNQCVKASLHITLDIMGLQSEWQNALRLAYNRLQTPAFVKQCVDADSKAALSVQQMDDCCVLSNSAGQNMSILWASKAVSAFERRQPMFEFVRTFLINLKTMDIELASGIKFLATDIGKYYFSSMLLRGPCTLDLVPKKCNSLPAKRKFDSAQQEGGRMQFPPELHDQTGVGILDLPSFMVHILFKEGGNRCINTTMPSLKSHLPSCIPSEHYHVSGAVKCMKIDRPACCARYLTAQKPALVQHKSNGCKVCVYRAPGIASPRVFVMCFGCKADGISKAPKPRVEQPDVMWPWVEVFQSDLSTMIRLARK